MIRRSEDFMSTRAPHFVALTTGAALFAIAATAATPPAESPLLGFSAEASRAELERESAFDGLISKADLRTWLEHLAARPPSVGKPSSGDSADGVAAAAARATSGRRAAGAPLPRCSAARSLTCRSTPAIR